MQVSKGHCSAMASSPETPRADGVLSDAAMAEFRQLVDKHPGSVAHKLHYNYNDHLVVSVPHLVAAIARTTRRPYREVA